MHTSGVASLAVGATTFPLTAPAFSTPGSSAHGNAAADESNKLSVWRVRLERLTRAKVLEARTAELFDIAVDYPDR